MHLTISPGKQAELAQKALRKAIRFTLYAAKEAHKPDSTYCIEPLPQDNRFRDAAWQVWPFKLIYQAFLLTQQWWYNATTGIEGVSRQHENMVEFTTQQILDMVSPSNFVFTNPVVLQTTLSQYG